MTNKAIAKKEKAIELLKEMDIYNRTYKASVKATRFASLNNSAVSGSTKSLNSTRR